MADELQQVDPKLKVKLEKEMEAKLKIEEILKETGCTVDVFIKIGTDKSIEGEWRILHKEQNE